MEVHPLQVRDEIKVNRARVDTLLSPLSSRLPASPTALSPLTSRFSALRGLTSDNSAA